jgi:hypothetical protein
VVKLKVAGSASVFIGDYFDKVREGVVGVNINNESKKICDNIFECNIIFEMSSWSRKKSKFENC